MKEMPEMIEQIVEQEEYFKLLVIPLEFLI